MLQTKVLKYCELCAVKVLEGKRTGLIRKFYHQQTKPKVKKAAERPIISCKRKEFDFYPGQTFNKLEPVSLASKGWQSDKSKGDYFIFHMTDNMEMLDRETTFFQTGLHNQLVSNLTKQGVVNPTLIQSKAVPVLLSRKNSLIAAETGCGKTLAYLLPLVQQIILQKARNRDTSFNAPLCLVLTPSRELAYQIESVARNLVADLDIKTEVIVGGGTKKKMLNPIFKETDLLVATIGALSKLTTTGIYKMVRVQHVVLDEADTLLDESFSEKMAHFLKKIPFHYSGESLEGSSSAQLTLVSATMPTNLPSVIADIIIPESLVRISTDQLHRILPHVPQRFLRLGRSMKPPQLLQLVKSDVEKRHPVMVFSNKSATCDWLSMFLNENGVGCINLNGDMHLQLRRDKFMQFQRGDVDVISCTDIGSRGLDTTRVKQVINYDFPKYTADYVHRCGRTGRIGSPSNCHITNFVSGSEEISLVQKMELAVRRQECLPNVNGNISGIIKNNMLRSLRENL